MNNKAIEDAIKALVADTHPDWQNISVPPESIAVTTLRVTCDGMNYSVGVFHEPGNQTGALIDRLISTMEATIRVANMTPVELFLAQQNIRVTFQPDDKPNWVGRMALNGIPVSLKSLQEELGLSDDPPASLFTKEDWKGYEFDFDAKLPKPRIEGLIPNSSYSMEQFDLGAEREALRAQLYEQRARLLMQQEEGAGYETPFFMRKKENDQIFEAYKMPPMTSEELSQTAETLDLMKEINHQFELIDAHINAGNSIGLLRAIMNMTGLCIQFNLTKDRSSPGVYRYGRLKMVPSGFMKDSAIEPFFIPEWRRHD